MDKIILASASPRRQELLGLLVERFEVVPSGADESLPWGTPPADASAAAGAAQGQRGGRTLSGALVIGADTVVDLDGKILGKPAGEREAVQMLLALSGRRHRVHTGIALVDGDGERADTVTTEVAFAPVTEAEARWYAATGEPLDKAGAYGIQRAGQPFITGIDGDFYTVMGLPVRRLYELLREQGVPLRQRTERM